MLLSVIVPVYNEEGNIDEFVHQMRPILNGLKESKKLDYEIIFCMDPSKDSTEKIIEGWNQKDPCIKLIKFSRRFGQPMATLAGLSYTKADAAVIIDVDLQDPPSLIPEMVEKWLAGFDVVYAQRKSRQGETWIKRFVSYVGYRVINKISDVNIPPNTGDFRLLSRRVIREVVQLKEHHGFLRGLVALVGFNQTAVEFDRPARFSGVGNYNRFLGSLKIGLNGVFCFSNYALSLSTLFGFFIAFFSFLLGVAYAVLKIMGTPFPLGNPTVVILVLFLGGVQLITIGIMGEYIGRIYDEVKQRPKFIVERKVGFELSTENKNLKEDHVSVVPGLFDKST